MVTVKQENREVPTGFKMSKYGVIPNDWKVVKVQDVFKKIKKPVDVIREDRYKQIGIRSHGKGIFYKEEVTGEELGNKSVFWIEPNCFIVNIVFAWELAVAKTTDNELGYIASHRFPMYKPIENRVDLDFITYLFKSPRGKNLLNLASPGGAGRNKTLGQKEFGELDILIPESVKEQKKIADILLTWDEAIKLKKDLIEQKREQKKGLMQRLMTGEVRMPGFEETWKEVTLGDIATIIMGQSPSSDSYNESQEGLPLIQGNADCSNRKTSPRMWTSQPTKKCEVGDIIMSVRAPVGHISRSVHNACIGRGVCAIRGEINQDFLYYYLIFKEDWWVRISQGSTFDSVNSKDINELEMKIPSDKEQRAIANVLKVFDKEIYLLEKELAELNQQKKGLMQLLLTGKVRVKV
ncbi:restriction endonuclease subunit S [Neobacillus sp. SCS-31]|uniref:restriction endonuclease subunit S n=1 Tax=Neobacillus oceani TaxID=3115292 RepID=UPI00390626AB